MSAAKFSIHNLATNLIMFPLGFISSIIITRLLGAEGRGVYTYFILLTTFFVPLLSIGYSGGVSYYIANRIFKIKDVFYTNVLISFLLGSIISLILYLSYLFGYLGKTAELIPKILMLGLFIVIPISACVLYTSKMLHSDNKFEKMNYLTIIRRILAPALIIIFALFVFEDRVLSACLGFILAIFYVAFDLFFYIQKNYKPVFAIQKDFIRKSFGYGIKGWLGDVAVTANVRVDQIILGMVASATSLGYYSISAMLSELFWVPANSVGSVLYNKIAVATKSGDLEAAIGTFALIHRILFWLAFIGLIGFIPFSFILIPAVYGAEFINSVLPFLLLLPGTLAMISTKLLTKLFTASGKINITNKVQIYSSVIGISLYALLIPLMGLKGAAIATSAGYIIGASFSCYYFVRLYGWNLSQLFSLKKQDIMWFKNKFFSFYHSFRAKL